MKLTDKKILTALKNGLCIRYPDMSKHVFLRCSKGKELYIEDWGQNMGSFKPYLAALEINTWYIADKNE